MNVIWDRVRSGTSDNFAVLLMSRVDPYHMPFQRFCHPSEATIDEILRILEAIGI